MKDFPKIERFGIGNKIDQTFIEVMELTFAASYLAPQQKIVLLAKAISKLDVLKFFMQLSWENKLFSDEKYIAISQRLEEVGRMLGGWKKGLESKTPAARQEKQQVSG